MGSVSPDEYTGAEGQGVALRVTASLRPNVASNHASCLQENSAGLLSILDLNGQLRLDSLDYDLS